MHHGQVIHDPAMPGLACVMQGDLFRDALSVAVREASDGAWTVAAVQSVRFRYRRARRAIVQFRVNLIGPSGPSTRTAAAWLHADPGKDRVRIRKAAGRASDRLPLELREPVSGARIAMLPHDHRLPGLMHWLNAEHAHPAHDPRAPTPTLLRYRPGISASLHLHGADGDSRFVKIVPPTAVDDLAQRWRSVCEQMTIPGLRVPRLLETDARNGVLIFAHVDGPDLGSWLEGGNEEIPDERIERVIDAIHGFTRLELRPDRIHDHAAMLNEIDSAAALIAAVHPESGRQALRIAASLRAAQPAPVLAPCHGDMKPEHLMIDGENSWLLDVEQTCQADPLTDLCLLAAHLQDGWHSGRYVADRCRRLLDRIEQAGSGQARAGGELRQRRDWLRRRSALVLARHHAQTFHPDWETRLQQALRLGSDDD
ncbi:MAG: hypothetical protein R3E83_15695 [Burkholderiaceae bacterium]